MPLYEYEHIDAACKLGKTFEIQHPMADKELTKCPECNQPIHKIISRINISTPKTNSQLKDLGFTKHVKRDDGVYENVTARDGDSKYVHRDKPETLPNFKKTISD